MSFPGFFAPLAAWLFFLTIPVVVFYFLKLKRPQLRVPSLVLWRQVLQDNRVNAPFQKFKRNLLLFLQLLLLALLVFAAMQPYFRGEADRAKRMVIMIDCSASMAALDQAGGKSRIDQAKQQITQIIEGLLSDQQVSLISFARTAKRLTDFTNNQRILKDALKGAVVQDVPGDLEDALRMTEAISRRTPLEQVLLYSDGNFNTDVDFALPFTLDYMKLDPAGPNVGITSLNAKRGKQGRWDLFIRLEVSKGSMPVTVELLQDDQVISTEDLVVNEDKPERMVFKVGVDKTSSIQARIRPDGFDALSSDNAAFLVLQPSRNVSAFVSHKLVPHRLAIAAMDDVVLYPPDGQDTSSISSFDLLITGDRADLTRNAVVTLTDGFVPDDLAELVDIETKDGSSLVDWDRSAPVLQHVGLTEVAILDEPISRPNVGAREYEARGYEILVHGRRGPLLLRKRQGQRVAYHLLFSTDRSTLPYRVGFPILLSNAVRQAMELSGLSERVAPRTGVLPTIPLSPSESYTVVGPAGDKVDMQSDENGSLNGVPAPRVGLYAVNQGADTRSLVGVSLLSTEESTLQGVPALQFNETSVSAVNKPIKMDRSFWPTLAWLALFVLVFEWWYFNRAPRWRLGAKGQA